MAIFFKIIELVVVQGNYESPFPRMTINPVSPNKFSPKIVSLHSTASDESFLKTSNLQFDSFS